MKRFTAVLMTILFVFPTVFYAEEFTAIENKFRAKVIAKAKKIGAIYKKKIIEAKKANDDELVDQLSQALENHKAKTKKILDSMTPVSIVEEAEAKKSTFSFSNEFSQTIRKRLNKSINETIDRSDLKKITQLTRTQTACDISGIQHLTNLKEISLTSSTDFDPGQISKLNNLEILRVYSTTPENTKKLSKITNIKQIYLNNLSIEKLNLLAANETLTSLYISCCKIAAITPLDNPPNLETVSIMGWESPRLSDLGSTLNLRNLTLITKSVHISDLPIQHLTKLTKLWLGGVEIDNINFLQSFPKLEELSLSESSKTFIDISQFSKNSNLKRLNLNRNVLKNCNQIQDKFPNLTYLSLSQCKLLNLNFIRPSTKLVRLECSGNQISDLKPLINAPNIKLLDLSSNKITSLQGTNHLLKLESLNLNANRIASLHELADIFLNNQHTRYSPRVYIENNQIDISKNTKNKAIIDKLESAKINLRYKVGNKL